jgi:hypothetical protein
LSTDVQTAQTIATAVQTAFSNEDAFNDATDFALAEVTLSPCSPNFNSEFTEALNMSAAPTAKSKKDLGNNVMDQKFYFTFSGDGKNLSVYVGSTDATHLAYPTVGKSLSK